ncbi:MAG: NAD-dependent epimerase/dehydratase family protein, partial [Bacteroidetes bacterium]|nr:NAD-dependent epimerase/dehydratase family protein [Bacteroidota bacterium]
MNILITGGTGFIGSRLVKHLVKNEHQVTILTRSEKSSSNRYITYKKWDAQKMPIGMGIYDAVINLAGASIAANRW